MTIHAENERTAFGKDSKLGIGITLGVGLGTIVGALTGTIGVSICLGVSLGIAIAIVWDRFAHKPSE